jgi:class 3 adenylate cyclase
MICHNCQAIVEKGAKFCKDCGNPIAQGPINQVNYRRSEGPEDQDQVRSSAPPPSTNSQSTRGISSGERRVVTILFCDIKGSTRLAEQLDPEEWAELINDALKELIEPVYRYGGNVARLMGDAILGFFGAPKAHEDDPQRAILASLDILAAMGEFNRQFNQNENLEFHVRVGINTGLVVVGDIGSDLRTEYTAMGDTVNLAARMEQTAEPDSVQITEDTYRLVAPFIEATDLGEIEIKGRSKPIRAYRVIGVKPEPGSHHALLGIQSPLVGRDSELGQLRKVIERVHQGRGQIVCVIGEAGIGKSRLFNELHAEWLQYSNSQTEASSLDKPSIPPNSWLEARSISYALNLPYGTFQQLVRNLCAIQPGEAPEIIREKISAECLSQPTLKDQSLQFTSVFETLLGVKTDTSSTLLEGKEFKRELFAAMNSIWMDQASHTPTALVFDDLQWADQTSVELLVHLFSLADEVPILFLCAFRPERQGPTWDIKQVAEREYPHLYTEINLQPLDAEHSDKLIHHLLTSTHLPSQLKHTILDKSEGNPFFIEQILHSLIEMGALHAEEESINGQAKRRWKISGDTRNITIPDTVQALLQSRIDRLDDDSRQTLQKAAVIGRSFNLRVLESIANGNTQLKRQLRKLERVDLVREESRVPEVEYVFRHALAQETVYKSILRKQRREYHVLVGEALENLYPDSLEETVPLIAHHYYVAEDSRALHYLIKAGDLASRLYANSEAIAHYDRAIQVAQKTRDYSSLEHIYIQKGRALELNAQYEQALANYSEMEQLAQELGDKHLQLASLLARSTLLSIPIQSSDPAQAHKTLDQALKLARELENRSAEAKILWNLSLIAGRFEASRQSITYGEEAIALARELNMKELLAFALNDLTTSYAYGGEVQRAREYAYEAQSIWKELGNKPMLADSLSTTVHILFLLTEFDQAIELSNQALQISRSIDNLWGQAYSLLETGKLFFERGEMDKAFNVMQDCIQLADKAGFVVPLSYTRAELGILYASLGGKGHASKQAEISSQIIDKLPLTMESLAYLQLARLYLLIGKTNEAETIFQRIEGNLIRNYLVGEGFYLLAKGDLDLHKRESPQVVESGEKLINKIGERIPYFLQHGYLYHGLGLLKLGRVDEAKNSLVEGRSLSIKLGTRWLLWQFLVALVEIEIQKGNFEEARDLYNQLVATIEFIADRVGNAEPSLSSADELRGAFLNRTQIQSALQLEEKLK